MKSNRLFFSFAFTFLVLISCQNGQKGNDQKQPDEKVTTVKVQQAGPGPGEQLYSKYCLTCHQPDGNGMKGMFPPLAGNKKITGPAEDLITIVLFGLEGPIEINGTEQNYAQPMPAQEYLEDQQIAEVLTYIRSAWGNKAPAVTAEEVATVRKKGKP